MALPKNSRSLVSGFLHFSRQPPLAPLLNSATTSSPTNNSGTTPEKSRPASTKLWPRRRRSSHPGQPQRSRLRRHPRNPRQRPRLLPAQPQVPARSHAGHAESLRLPHADRRPGMRHDNRLASSPHRQRQAADHHHPRPRLVSREPTKTSRNHRRRPEKSRRSHRAQSQPRRHRLPPLHLRQHRRPQRRSRQPIQRVAYMEYAKKRFAFRETTAARKTSISPSTSACTTSSSAGTPAPR